MKRLSIIALFLVACGPSDADEAFIGGECTVDDDCGDESLDCVTNFNGGYCGATGCTTDDDCLTGSVCVELDGTNYCFLICEDKADCNINRSVANESNCSSSVAPLDGGPEKVCVPPSG